METVSDFTFWAPKSLQMVIAAMKLRCLLLGRQVMTNLDSIFKSRDITLPPCAPAHCPEGPEAAPSAPSGTQTSQEWQSWPEPARYFLVTVMQSPGLTAAGAGSCPGPVPPLPQHPPPVIVQQPRSPVESVSQVRVPAPLAGGGSTSARGILRLCPASACQTGLPWSSPPA